MWEREGRILLEAWKVLSKQCLSVVSERSGRRWVDAVSQEREEWRGFSGGFLSPLEARPGLRVGWWRHWRVEEQGRHDVIQKISGGQAGGRGGETSG